MAFKSATAAMKMHNFNSGPSILPQEVVEQTSQAIKDYNNTGLSILEIGHRSKWFIKVMEEARALVKELMNINEEHEVLFLHGGATTQFMQIPLNLLNSDETAAYCNNGIWGCKAIKEAKLFGNVHIAASSEDKNHTYISKQLCIPDNAKYLHYTTNNTVEGTQWHHIPETKIPLVADMSSDIFSKPMQFSSFSLIYAGAQKNIGAAGVTIVVIKKEILGNVSRQIPSILNYCNHIEANSLLNTPPVAAVYISMLTMRWIKQKGGLQEMENMAKERSGLLYKRINSLPVFSAKVNSEDRSLMNAVFTAKTPELEKQFLEECSKNGMVGVKGHRSVGGLRISMYNAMPLSSVEAICDLMTDFSNKNS